MTYSPISFAGFGAGLNLRDKVDAVSEQEAIDCLNVQFTERGAVQQRAGYDNFTSALTNNIGSLHAHYRASSTPQLLAGCGTRLEALSSTGTVVDSDTGNTDGVWDFARFGTPNDEVSYAGNGSDLLHSWDGSSWAEVSDTPKAGALAVFATANRLVASRFLGTAGGPTGDAGTSSPSHVYFSDAGDAETWDSDNFIQLTPGDGEAIQAVIAWREFVFVFKESKFFVFYGESVDSDGEPVFDYTPIDTGVGLVSPRAVCADDTGVYFLSQRGVFRTTGNEPELLSDVIEPIFLGGSSDFYLGGELSHSSITNCAMTAHEGRIFLSFPTDSANDRTLIYDVQGGWWSLWDIPAACLASFAVDSQPELFFATTKTVYRHNSTYTNDNGTAITSRWRSGWFDYGDPNVKRLRETKLWGSGVVSVGTSHDFRQATFTTVIDLTDPTASTWGGSTWGGTTWAEEAGLIAQLRRVAVRGTVFSLLLTNSTLDQTWALHRATQHFPDSRIPTVKAS